MGLQLSARLETQLTHVAPPVPQEEKLGVPTQLLFEQHPPGHEVPSQTQLTPLHC